MKVLNTAIPAGLSIPTGKVGREWTKVYIDNLGEFIELMEIDTMRYDHTVEIDTMRYDHTVECAVTNDNIRFVQWHDLKVHLLRKGVVVAKGRLPC